jgi:hypothetical protein
MGRVIDKYRVVDRTVRAWAPAWQVVLGAWLVGVGLVAWSAEDVHGWVVAHDTLPGHDALVATSGALEDGVRATGLLAARRTVDGWFDPLQRTDRVLERVEQIGRAHV